MVNFRHFGWDVTPRGGDDRSLLDLTGNNCDLAEFLNKKKRKRRGKRREISLACRALVSSGADVSLDLRVH
jgi:hypothetical protein